MHRKGVDAEHYVKEAKETIAKVLKVNAKDIYFTSGGTESDNLPLPDMLWLWLNYPNMLPFYLPFSNSVTIHRCRM